MKKLTQYLLCPNAWVGLFSILAVAGLLLCAIGLTAQVRQFTVVGLWLIAPILIGGFTLLFIVLPVLMHANGRQRK